MSYVLDSYTKLYIPFNGTDGDTDDQTALTGQTVSLEGNACLDTAQKKNGTASLLLDSTLTQDYATVPDSDDWNFVTGDFTIDGYFRFSSLPSTSSKCTFVSQYEAGVASWYLAYDNNWSGYGKVLILSSSVGSLYASWEPSINTWYHIEVDRSGSSGYLFIEGTPLTITANTILAKTMPDVGAALQIGAYNTGWNFKGWVDSPRIHKGIARHTTTFIPPNEASFLELF